MGVCKTSVDELLTELSGDVTQMDGFVVKLEQLLNELASVETLAAKLFVFY